MTEPAPVERKKKGRKQAAFLNAFTHAKWASVEGRDGAEMRGLSSEGKGKRGRQRGCSRHAPSLAPSILAEGLSIRVPPPSLSYSFFAEVMG